MSYAMVIVYLFATMILTYKVLALMHFHDCVVPLACFVFMFMLLIKNNQDGYLYFPVHFSHSVRSSCKFAPPLKRLFCKCLHSPSLLFAAVFGLRAILHNSLNC